MIYFILLLGFVMITIGTIFLVDYGDHIFSRKNEKRDILIMMNIPFLSMAIASAFMENTELLFGILVGSALFQLLVLVGVYSMFREVAINKILSSREIPFLIFSEFVLLFLSGDYLLHGKYVYNGVSRWDGILLILLFLLYCLSFFLQKKEKGLEKHPAEKEEEIPSKKSVILLMIGYFLAFLLILLGSYFSVKCTSQFAFLHKIDQKTIGMTLMTFGASLPGLLLLMYGKDKEIVRKNMSSNMIEGLITAVIVNLLLTMGIGAVIRPIAIQMNHIQDIIFLYISSLLLWIFSRHRGKINRLEGCIFVSIYIVYIFYVCVQ